ncbi:hypothetical protein OE903_23430 [Bacillus sp. B6(2022)]|nr:hypothetical protein [Bacillus sp. B6(2022)]
MCERVLGIDAGLKSGWGTLVGGLAMAKGASNLTKKELLFLRKVQVCLQQVAFKQQQSQVVQ